MAILERPPKFVVKTFNAFEGESNSRSSIYSSFPGGLPTWLKDLNDNFGNSFAFNKNDTAAHIQLAWNRFWSGVFDLYVGRMAYYATLTWNQMQPGGPGTPFDWETGEPRLIYHVMDSLTSISGGRVRLLVDVGFKGFGKGNIKVPKAIRDLSNHFWFINNDSGLRWDNTAVVPKVHTYLEALGTAMAAEPRFQGIITEECDVGDIYATLTTAQKADYLAGYVDYLDGIRDAIGTQKQVIAFINFFPTQSQQGWPTPDGKEFNTASSDKWEQILGICKRDRFVLSGPDPIIYGLSLTKYNDEIGPQHNLWRSWDKAASAGFCNVMMPGQMPQYLGKDNPPWAAAASGSFPPPQAAINHNATYGSGDKLLHPSDAFQMATDRKWHAIFFTNANQVYVEAVAAGRAYSTQLAIAWEFDMGGDPPPPPEEELPAMSGFSATPAADGSININGTITAGDNPTLGVKILRDGIQIDDIATSSLPYNASGLEKGRAYTWQAVPYSVDGNGTCPIHQAISHNASALYVNIGASGFTDPAGISWVADTAYVINAGNIYSIITPDAGGTYVPQLFRTGRWYGSLDAGNRFDFSLSAGSYWVHGLFQEQHAANASAGLRVFNMVVAESGVGDLSLREIDAGGSVGEDFAHIVSQQVTTLGGTLQVRFDHVAKNPHCMGLVIVPPSATPPPANDLAYTQLSTYEDITPGTGSYITKLTSHGAEGIAIARVINSSITNTRPFAWRKTGDTTSYGTVTLLANTQTTVYMALNSAGEVDINRGADISVLISGFIHGTDVVTFSTKQLLTFTEDGTFKTVDISSFVSPDTAGVAIFEAISSGNRVFGAAHPSIASPEVRLFNRTSGFVAGCNNNEVKLAADSDGTVTTYLIGYIKTSSQLNVRTAYLDQTPAVHGSEQTLPNALQSTGLAAFINAHSTAGAAATRVMDARPTDKLIQKNIKQGHTTFLVGAGTNQQILGTAGDDVVFSQHAEILSSERAAAPPVHLTASGTSETQVTISDGPPDSGFVYEIFVDNTSDGDMTTATYVITVGTPWTQIIITARERRLSDSSVSDFTAPFVATTQDNTTPVTTGDATYIQEAASLRITVPRATEASGTDIYHIETRFTAGAFSTLANAVSPDPDGKITVTQEIPGVTVEVTARYTVSDAAENTATTVTSAAFTPLTVPTDISVSYSSTTSFKVLHTSATGAEAYRYYLFDLSASLVSETDVSLSSLPFEQAFAPYTGGEVKVASVIGESFSETSSAEPVLWTRTIGPLVGAWMFDGQLGATPNSGKPQPPITGLLMFEGGLGIVRHTRLIGPQIGSLVFQGFQPPEPVTGVSIRPEQGVVRFDGGLGIVLPPTEIDIIPATGTLRFDGGTVTIPASFRWTPLGNDAVDWTPL
jgi:hypothetical protein